ncbi:ABC transporter permease [Afifella sp. IM 167]|uniref:ABC transporter permease n=1 Tax=Afifella sp. IM 167 TaxID=2033586 RepID=UPI001CCBC957|nr:ABC transporter permease [Afifella sp. IM 167]MBZ8132159.1 ABC transporter permease [Afifella sp. IM 167]
MTDIQIERADGRASALAAGSARRLLAGIRFVAPVFGMLLVWELVVRAGLVDGRVLPPPSLIAARGFEMVFDTEHAVLLQHIGHSLYRAVAAFAIAVVVALPLGFWLGLNRTAYNWISPILSVLLPLPAVAWTPIFLVTLGHGDATIISVCFLGAVFPVLYSTIQGVRAIPPHTIWVVRSMGAPRHAIFTKVLVPASLPTVMTGFKLGLAHSWRTLVAAEMLAALSYGLGYMIFAARQYMDTQTMFVGIVLLAMLGFIFEHFLFGTVERATIRRWYAHHRKGG